MPDLPPGANVELPGAALGVALDGPFDLSALVLSASGAVAGDADMVFFNQPDAPGVRLRGPQLTVRPEALRRGAERVGPGRRAYPALPRRLRSHDLHAW